MAVVFADVDVGMIVVVEVSVHGEVDAARRVFRCGDAADVEHRGHTMDVGREIGPVAAAIARHVDAAIVGAGIQHIRIQRRFGDRGQRAEIRLAVMPREGPRRNGGAHHGELFAVDAGGKVRTDGAPAHAAVVGAE